MGTLWATAPGRAATNALGSGGPWKELALAAIEANNRCEVGGLKPTPRFTAALANLRMKDVDVLASKVTQIAKKRDVATMAKAKSAEVSDGKYLTWQEDDRVGVFPPFSYWDPLGLAVGTTAGQLAYFREAELKHGRICMLASLGFFVQERFHPLFGGNIDVPAMQALGATELRPFWPAVLAASGGIELATGVGRSEGDDSAGFTPSLKDGIVPGDIGFDPLGLAAKYSDEEFVGIQNRELAHCRLAMIATLGMLLQEIILPEQKLYGA